MDAGRRSADDWHALCAHRTALERIARPRVPCPSDVEDVVQEAILRAAENGHVRVDDAGAWMTRVVVNLCHDLHRRAPLVDLAEAELPSPRPSLEEAAVVRDELRRVQHRWKRLPVRQQRAVAMRSQGAGVDEVARALGTTYKTAESLLSRARSHLRGPALVLAAVALGLRRTARTAPAGLAVTLTGLGLAVAVAEGGTPVATTAAEQRAPTTVTAPSAVVSHPVRAVTRPRAAAPASRAPAAARPSRPARPSAAVRTSLSVEPVLVARPAAPPVVLLAVHVLPRP